MIQGLVCGICAYGGRVGEFIVARVAANTDELILMLING